MSKKPAALKVHQLAKELGVSSKDIVARCQAEEIPDIVNHLSPVSAGLALTVREWFANAGGGAATATATADAPAHASTDDAVGTEADGDAAASKTAKRPAAKKATVAADNAAEVPQEATRAVAKRATKKSTGGEVAAETPSPTQTSTQAPAQAPNQAPTQVSAQASDATSSRGTGAKHAGPILTPDASSSSPVARPDASSAGSTTDTPSTTPRATPASPRVAASAPTSTEVSATPSSSAASGAASSGAAASGAAASGTPTASVPPARSSTFRIPAGLSAKPVPRMDGAKPSASPSSSPSAASGSGLTSASDGRGAQGGGSATSPAQPRRVITAPPPPPSSMTDTSGASPVMNVPSRPSVVGPVGPQLSLREKTTLSGPKVIRVEQADNLPTPAPMRRTGTGGVGGAGGARGRTGGAGTGSGPAGRPDARRGGIGASRTGRAGDSARVAFGAQDLRDRQARLDASKGFMSSHRGSTGRGPSMGGGGGGGGGQRMERRPGEVQQIHVSEPLTIKELSAATGVKAVDIIKKLFLGGTMATINSAIDRVKAIEMMMEFDIDLIVDEAKSAAEIIEERFKGRERVDERRRAPIVTILGHVDHGKTSLLDRIRKTNIAEGEAGGITQSTRAFCVPVKSGDVDRMVTFIDTPGHEAFTSMRARGAKVTDIVVLVVSAVDGVMPQTVESIQHAKAAGVPIVVAMNKIDRPDANESNIRRLLGQLAENGLNPVEWGGDTEVIKTSATRGDGIEELLAMLDYQAELLELKADFGGMARGTVLEASIEEGRGPVARVMVQEGRLKKGDFIVIGRGYGRVRDIINDKGERTTEAFPSTPVAISGIDELPDAGDKAFVVESIRAAEEAAEERRRIDRERELAAPKITLDNIFKHLEKQGRKELALVVKGDVQGSVEALKGMLSKLPTEEVVISVKSASAGGINESDVTLAEATKAIIVGFNVTSSGKARQMAEAKGIEIRLYEVIYDLIDDVTKAARGMLAPELKLEVLGHAEVKQVFKISKVGAIAGCNVLDGIVERNAQIRVTRNGIVIEKDRRLEQLKRFKDDVKEVRAGMECGMKIVGYDDIKAGDVLECYKTVTVARS